ncbi:MAG: molybdopterin-guanine dinucleotide biosynthesis protein MobB [Megasphaera sp.]|uniref:molybdopterin-guanine dinucleotide biosynthesis protein MobB n=1 Tax=Megasphaera sp. TaxID=2023260 RepID=UPI0025C62210|nr:molybdopterin-guanine dinucleotide biosynthesis protein MobB [Megasphaera sp.]MCF0153750.1 molybdopterin-guanine dinucleotide biosynthesis protein MobB [Megasphaera sp.]MCI7600972.1 molybdopterin-guanine dinucleotide biosynthesis protein MobB [Megasphaera sp.]
MIKTLRPLSLGLIILAGGHSTRMGRDKAALPWHDTDLLTDLLLRSQSYPFTERLLSINRPYESSDLPVKLARTVRLVTDSYPDCGPLGGLEAALYSGTCDFYLVLSVDLPFYDFTPVPDWVKLLRHQPGLQAIIPRTENGQEQPLAALYSRQLLPTATDLLQKGEYRLRSLYQAVPAAYVDETFRSALYFNINTPKAYEAAKGRDTNSRRQVPVVTLTAPNSGDGKTTAAAAAITELTHRGYQVAYIKSSHHTVACHKTGSDTDRARKAGAVSVCLCSPADIPAGIPKEDYILFLSQQQLADLVLVESRSHGPFPQIDVTQADGSRLVNDILFLTGYRSSVI